MQRNRPGLVALFAVITEIVVVAAAGNQSVARTITKHVGSDPSSFPRRALAALPTFPWRFSSPAGEPAQHLWGAQFAGIGAFLVITYLLVFAAARGRAGLGQAFLGIWAAVIVAAVGGAIVRGVVYPFSIAKGSRLSVGVFDSPNGEVTLFGAGCGLLVALVAIMVAAATRRSIEPEPGLGVGDDSDGQPREQFFEQPPAFTRPGLAAPPAPVYMAPAAATAAAPVSQVPDYDRPSYSGPGYSAPEPLVAPPRADAPTADAPTEALPVPGDDARTETFPAATAGPDTQTAAHPVAHPATNDAINEDTSASADAPAEMPAETPSDTSAEPDTETPAEAGGDPSNEPPPSVTGYTGGEQHTAELPRVPDEREVPSAGDRPPST